MNARIFVHPRCVSGPAQGALIAHLKSQGYDVTQYGVGPKYPGVRGQELVRILGQCDGTSYLERMDGTKFSHRIGDSEPTLTPETA